MSKPALGVPTFVGFLKEEASGTKIALGASGHFLDLISESFNYKAEMLNMETIIGSREMNKGHSIISHHDARGSCVFRPRADYTEELLELLLGLETVNTWSANDGSVPMETATFEISKGGTNEVRLIGMQPNTAKFSSTANQPLICDMAFLGRTGERDPGDLTDLTAIDGYAEWKDGTPFMHGDLAIDATGHAFLGGATGPECRSIEFTIDNGMGEDDFVNSLTRTFVAEGEFKVNGSMEIAYNSVSKAFWTDQIAANKINFTMTYTDGENNTLVFAFCVKLEGELPSISDKGPQWLTLNFFGVADTDDITPTDASGITATLTLAV